MKIVNLLLALNFVFLIAACDSGEFSESDPTDVAVGNTEMDAADAFVLDNFDLELDSTEPPAFLPRLGFALPTRGTLNISTPVIGDTLEGDEIRIDCEPGHVLVGLEGFATDDKLNQIAANCVEADSVGGWMGSPQLQGEPVGISSGDNFRAICPNNSAVTGITGIDTSFSISFLQLHCRKLATSKTVTGEESNVEVFGRFINRRQTVRLCGGSGVGTGIHARANANLVSFGIACLESPANAGRWSSTIDWPVQAIHATMTPTGSVLTYGFNVMPTPEFDYDIWTPELGISSDAHNTIASDVGVFSFCNAAVVMPDNGNILMPGGTRAGNGGLFDAPVLNTQSESLSRAPDMANRRWYPTTTVLPNGEILVAGGRDSEGHPSDTPEVYTPATNQWRSLFGANMEDLHWYYPRHWVAADGRVFGVSDNQMYYIDTEGSGSIERLEPFPKGIDTRWNSTEALYRTGKILQVGGEGNKGSNVVVYDLDNDPPQVRPTNPVRVPRGVWPDLSILADGKVMVHGGAQGNLEIRAAFNPEIWDPETEQWSALSAAQWPRRYHSTTVLLQDGTVMAAGGNYLRNAEIFSPPYLFNDEGNLATRPEISWAPQKAAYGQTISLITADQITRVTMVKNSSVTHSFNVEQRFVELPVTAQTDNGIQVQIPSSNAIVTPGYYMLFSFNAEGVPSIANIVKVGNEPGAEPPASLNASPEPAELNPNNLLSNGGFEQNKASWIDCASPTLSAITDNASNGEHALHQESGACLFQQIIVQPGVNYTATCEASALNSDYSSISLNMLDSQFNELANEESVVTGSEYTNHSIGLTAPSSAFFAAITLYSEGPSRFDSCLITAGGTAPLQSQQAITPPATNLLLNSEFDEGKVSWTDCGSEQLTEIVDSSDGNELQIENSGCIFQEFPVVAGQQYGLQCSAMSEGTKYSSISFQMSDDRFAALDSTVSVIGPGSFRPYTSTLTAPVRSATGVVTIYSEDLARIEACYVEPI